MQTDKERLDVLVVERGLVESRNKAKELILSGKILVDGIPVRKPGSIVSKGSNVVLTSEEKSWVSRGAYKLIKALDVFGIDPTGCCCVDIGASTGGFTEVLLERGARMVYAVDVGYGQLAWKLRQDPRVKVMERTNARYLTPEMFEETIDLISIDVSFISLKLILPVAEKLLRSNGYCICLVKPQFEAGREKVGKNGVIKDPNVHLMVLSQLFDFIDKETNFKLCNADFSPILGPKGNREFLFLLKKNGETDQENIKITKEKLEEVVKSSHEKESLM